ncbi:phosphatase PAP2 family protein [Oceanobacillus sp. FSL H7-0719]|uniref:phosphatase PAP2 family protein n=1 Tax=Oceanobacillus sp. FSL H7-0719 TaxID=2954507 RepID=UPI003248CF5C
MKRGKNISIFLLILIVAAVGIWTFRIMNNQMPYVDAFTRGPVRQFEGSLLYDFFRIVTNLGSEFFLYPFVVITAILLFIWFKHWLPAFTFAGGILIAHFVNVFIKKIVTRERPSILAEANAEGYSFPSGHAMISMVCYGLLAYFITKRLRSKTAILLVQILFSLLIFLIGISRYVINVHYLTDIIAGFFFGFLLLRGFIYLYERINTKRSPS